MFKLVTIVALACILGASLVKSEVDMGEVVKQFMGYAEECVGKVGATPADIDDMMKKQPAASQEAKCLRACVMKKYHVMTEDGKLVREGAMEKAKIFCDDADKLKIAAEIIDHCIAAQTATDICDAAEEYGKCFKEQAVARGIKSP